MEGNRRTAPLPIFLALRVDVERSSPALLLVKITKSTPASGGPSCVPGAPVSAQKAVTSAASPKLTLHCADRLGLSHGAYTALGAPRQSSQVCFSRLRS